MGFYDGKPIESAVYYLCKQINVGNDLCFIISSHRNSVKWIKRLQLHIGKVTIILTVYQPAVERAFYKNMKYEVFAKR